MLRFAAETFPEGTARGGAWTIVVAASLLLTACGKGGTANSGSSSAQQISIHGEVNQTNNTYCDTTPDLVSHSQIVFRDPRGKVVGTTTVGPATTRSPSGGIFAACGRTGHYSIRLAKMDSYRVTWVGVDKTPRAVSYKDLAMNGFEFDLFVSFNEP